ncbi:EAL domain-containing protein [Caenispirillum salinarum]|uniref:bifunctional diguanylate cyclase/phosphodiesterase n=1 Tax=Caenispirillum salinarum TaxID=859058 RepID=UPI00384DDA1B
MAFSLSAAVVGAVLGSVVLAVALAYLARLPNAAGGLKLWALSFFVHALQLLVVAPDPLTYDPGILFVSESLNGLTAVLLLAGTWRFLGNRARPAVFAVLLATAVGWALTAAMLDLSFLWTTLPQYVFMAGVMLITAWAFWARRAEQRDNFTYIAALFVAWAAHTLGYPFLGRDPELAPIGFLIAQGLTMAIAVGFIVLVQRRQAKELAAAREAAVEAERVAAAREDHIRAVLNTVADGIVTVGADGRVSDFNAEAERIFGMHAVTVVGGPAARVLPAEERGANPEGGLIVETSSGLGDDGRAVRVTRTQARRGDGGLMTIDLRVACMRDAQGLHHVAVVRDISEALVTEHLDDLLQRLDQQAFRGASLDQVAGMAAERMAEVSNLPLVWIGTKELDGTVSLRGTAGERAPEVSFEGEIRWDAAMPEFCPAAEAVRLGKTQQVTVSELVGPPGPCVRAIKALGLDGVTAVPLHAQNEVVGVIVLAGDTAHLSRPDIARIARAGGRLGSAFQIVRDQERLRLQGTAMAAAANAIFITDLNGSIEWVNDAFTRLSGYDRKDVLGKTPAVLKSGVQSPETYASLWRTVKGGRVWRGEMVERRKDATLYTVDQTVAPITDEHGKITHFVAIHEDVTERKRAEERIRYLANYDTLTRLPNRVLFRDRLHQAVSHARRMQKALAVMFVDLDRFSRINDTLGHAAGDQLLSTMAERIQLVAEDADTVARIGGDEFAVIQSDLSNAEAAAVLAKKVVDAVGTTVDMDGHEIHLGANVGIAIFPQDGEDPDHLIKNADMAMYRAIRSETASYYFFSSEMNAEAQVRLGIEGDLRRAVERDELTLFYQPQISVATGRVIGVEALLRWQHPEQGMVSPARFIPVAEDSGLILPIGEWVMSEAMRQSRAWLDDGLPPITMAINISAVQFRQDGIIDRIKALIAEHQVDPTSIEMELTESMLMQDARQAIELLTDLSDLGIQLAIDDFGTGYSSLSYLKQFPVDKLKVDQSFVRHITTDANDAVIARATINLGHSLGLRVVAEGVEDLETYAYLRAENCDVAQGYYFGRPMPADQIADLLRREAAGETLVPEATAGTAAGA